MTEQHDYKAEVTGDGTVSAGMLSGSRITFWLNNPDDAEHFAAKLNAPDLTAEVEKWRRSSAAWTSIAAGYSERLDAKCAEVERLTAERDASYSNERVLDAQVKRLTAERDEAWSRERRLLGERDEFVAEVERLTAERDRLAAGVVQLNGVVVKWTDKCLALTAELTKKRSEVIALYSGNVPDPEAPPIPCVEVDPTGDDGRRTWRAMGEDVPELGDEWERKHPERTVWLTCGDAASDPEYVYLIRRTTPPAPRTVTVELPEDVAKRYGTERVQVDDHETVLEAIAAALTEDGDR